MATTRQNPDDGLLDVLHPDTNSWARVVALLQVAGGLNVSLTPVQFGLLQSIQTKALELTEIQANGDALNNLVGQLQTLVGTIKNSLDSSVSPRLAVANLSLQDLSLLLTQVQVDSSAIRTALESSYSYQASLDELKVGLAELRAEIVSGAALSTEANNLLRDLIATQNTVRPARRTTKLVSLPTANAEVQVSFDQQVVRLLRVRCRKNGAAASDLRYAFENGLVNNSNGAYMSLPAGELLEISGVRLEGTLYLASTQAGFFAEVEMHF